MRSPYLPSSTTPIVVTTLALGYARVIALAGAHFLTTSLFVTLLATLAIAGLVTAITLLDVVFSFIDAVDASVVVVAGIAR